ncbi:MAG: hypothetical protein RR228_03530 [Bacilli bacterium]
MEKKNRNKLIIGLGVFIILLIISIICYKSFTIGSSNMRTAIEEVDSDEEILEKALDNYFIDFNKNYKDKEEEVKKYKYENFSFIKEIDGIKYFNFKLLKICKDNRACLKDNFNKEGDYVSKRVYAKIKKQGYSYVVKEFIDNKPNELN